MIALFTVPFKIGDFGIETEKFNPTIKVCMYMMWYAQSLTKLLKDSTYYSNLNNKFTVQSDSSRQEKVSLFQAFS